MARSMSINTLTTSRGRSSLEPAVADMTLATPAEPYPLAEAGNNGSIAEQWPAQTWCCCQAAGVDLRVTIVGFWLRHKGQNKSRKVKLTYLSPQQVTSSERVHFCTRLCQFSCWKGQLGSALPASKSTASHWHLPSPIHTFLGK